MGCNLCRGRGVVPVGAGHALCPCIVLELGTLRATLVAAGLLPPDHWTRGLPPRGLTGSIPPERSMVVLSTRKDGYRVVAHSRAESSASYANSLEAIAPDGSVLRRDGVPLWWARVEDAERSIDASYPMNAEEACPS